MTSFWSPAPAVLDGSAQTNIGELVVVTFDEVTRTTKDPEQASRLAARVVAHLLRRVRRD